MKCKCEKGHIFYARYDSIVNHGRGCPICAKESRQKSKRVKLENIKKRFFRAGYEIDTSFNYE